MSLVVTGGGSGIGLATCKLAVERGHRVIALDVNPAAAASIGAEAVICDVRRESDVDEAMASLDDLAGLICCAGVDAGGLAHELETATWEYVLGVNLLGTHLACRAALRSFLHRGVPGAIVCVSSPTALAAIPGGTAAYSASKGGVSALVRTLAVDYASHGIRINAVVPGSTETPLMWANVPDTELIATREALTRSIPLGRLATPEEIAVASLWLLSNEASYVTGSHLVVDGGLLARLAVDV
jgi:NAD(P)-dependent dehydrogenase (short-subunit alcohol dehydrogenase family)